MSLKNVDMETVLVCAFMAAIASVTAVFLGVTFVGVTFSQCNSTLLIGVGTGLCGLLWGLLLIGNCQNLIKNPKYSD